MSYFNPIFKKSVADIVVNPVVPLATVAAPLPAINFNDLPTEVITYIFNQLDNPVKSSESDMDKCNALGRYCMVNRNTRKLCRTDDIQYIIKLCKINKIRFINSKRPKPGMLTYGMDYGQAVSFYYNIHKIDNKWRLHDQIPDSLADIARELEIKKYCFYSTTTGYVVLTDNKYILLPEKGTVGGLWWNLSPI